MSAEQDGANQRKSFRFPILEQQEAELLVGESWIPVQIRDASAGGFAVLTAARPVAKYGQTLQLRTSSGQCEVRVAHLTETEPAGGGQRARFCLGLERLRDLPDPEEERSQRAGWRACLLPVQAAPSSGTMMVAGLVVTMLVIGALAAAILLLRHSDHPTSQCVTAWGSRVPGCRRVLGAERVAARGNPPHPESILQRSGGTRPATPADRSAADRASPIPAGGGATPSPGGSQPAAARPLGNPRRARGKRRRAGSSLRPRPAVADLWEGLVRGRFAHPPTRPTCARGPSSRQTGSRDPRPGRAGPRKNAAPAGRDWANGRPRSGR